MKQCSSDWADQRFDPLKDPTSVCPSVRPPLPPQEVRLKPSWLRPLGSFSTQQEDSGPSLRLLFPAHQSARPARSDTNSASAVIASGRLLAARPAGSAAVCRF